MIFSKQAPDLLWGISRCLGLPRRPAPDGRLGPRGGALHAGGGRPTEAFAAFCGALPVGWLICEARDPEAKGILERHQGFMRTNFEPGRAFAWTRALPGRARQLGGAGRAGAS